MSQNKINVLFVCTGNICRSPMAEYLFRSRLGPGTTWTVASAGLSAADGLPASQMAIAVMDKIAIDLKAHRSRELTEEMVAAATIIIVMTTTHAAELKERFPKARDRLYLLGSFNKHSKENEILDPIGSSIECYRRTLKNIAAGLDGLMVYLQSYQESKRSL